MMSSVIGGAMLPHAPQFFTMPETEDRDTVARVKTVAAEIGTPPQGSEFPPTGPKTAQSVVQRYFVPS